MPAIGRRCDNGCESWPDAQRYQRCPVCGQETTRYSDLDPITQPEASAREFELFYERWDTERSPSRLAADAPDARGSYAPREDRLALPPGPAG